MEDIKIDTSQLSKKDKAILAKVLGKISKKKKASSICLGDTVHKEFCMDKTEYTNLGDTLPLTMSDPLRNNEPVNFTHAEKVCEEKGKREVDDSAQTAANGEFNKLLINIFQGLSDLRGDWG